MSDTTKFFLSNMLLSVVLLFLTYTVIHFMGYRLLKEQDISVLNNIDIKKSDIINSEFFKDTLERINANNYTNIEYIKSQRDSALAAEIYFKSRTNTYKARIIELENLSQDQKHEIMNVNKHLSNIDNFISTQYLQLSNLTVANVELKNTIDSIKNMGSVFNSGSDEVISVKDTVKCNYYYESDDMMVKLEDTTLTVNVDDEIVVSTTYVNERVGLFKRNKYYSVSVTNTNEYVEIHYNEVRIDPRNEKTVGDKLKQASVAVIVLATTYFSGALSN